jgi:hypothetical protein
MNRKPSAVTSLAGYTSACSARERGAICANGLGVAGFIVRRKQYGAGLLGFLVAASSFDERPAINLRHIINTRISRFCRNRLRYCSRSALACFEYRPCFVTAHRMRSIPSGVFTPVLRPPWSLHRAFGIAGHRQGAPLRFLAPHRAAFERSP